MGEIHTVDAETLRLCQYFWEEFRYRLDLIWQQTFRFTTVVVLISIIPYVQQDVASLLGDLILLAPIFATALALVGLAVVQNELTLFERIMRAYWRQQNKILDDDLKHDAGAKRPFFVHIRLYLLLLALVSFANGLVVWQVWIPGLSSGMK